MLDPGVSRRSAASPGMKSTGFRGAWCCSFASTPHSPDCRPSSRNPYKHSAAPTMAAPKVLSVVNSLHSSPSPSSKLGLGIIDPRRILSPGRVSPIDSDLPLVQIPEKVSSFAAIEEREISYRPAELNSDRRDGGGRLDLRLKVFDGNGRRLVMEMDSGVLCSNSSYFAGLVLRSRSNFSDSVKDCCEIQVEGVENLDVFREMIEMMYDRDGDEMNWLMKAGVSRAIDLLEVSVTVTFDRGTSSCLKYLEAVPWSEHEEEKLKTLFSKCTFDSSVTEEILARLHPEDSSRSGELAVQLIRSVANSTNINARKELQTLVNGLLSKSSVYSKELTGLNKDSLYDICDNCVNLLVKLFKEASNSFPPELVMATTRGQRPLVERVSKQVENLNWLLDILIDKHMAVDFVSLWAAQDELASLHERTSSMIRYELSRISSSIFVAIGRGKVQCHVDVRRSVLRRWFRPLLLDFGWIQRCPKGLDVRMMEEGVGQAILTLPLKHQQTLFVEWFQFFGMEGSECPNLSKAFQVWWRRSFVRTVESHG